MGQLRPRLGANARTHLRMKLRVTKKRIALAIALLPVLHVLNSGPLLYCTLHFGLPEHIWLSLYGPLNRSLIGTPLWRPYTNYLGWCARDDRWWAIGER